MEASRTVEREKVMVLPIEDVFLKRRSSRLIQDKLIEYGTLMSLFEAARWAPSSFNNQPWRFTYAFKNTKHWHEYFNLLYEGNKKWAISSPVLIVVMSNKFFSKTNRLSRTHSFDVGAACQNLALQATHLGLIAHAMEGFDYEHARVVVNIPEHFEIEAMIAIGYPADDSSLSIGQESSEVRSERKLLRDIVFEGKVPSWEKLVPLVMT